MENLSNIEAFTKVLLTVFSLILLTLPGFLLGKATIKVKSKNACVNSAKLNIERKKLLPENASKALTTVMLYIGQPMLTFMSFQKCKYSESVMSNLLLIAGLAAIVHIVMLLLMFLFFSRKWDKDKKLRIVGYASVFGNCGFMGLPFLQMLFGSTSPEAVMYGAVVTAVFNFLSWTFGIFIITGERKYIEIKKIILNPPFIALIFSLPLFIILKRPINEIGEAGTFIRGLFEKIYVSFNYLSDLVTPLSMIIVGIRLSEMKMKQIFLSKYPYISSAFKLIVMPALAFTLCTIFNVNELIKWAIVFEASMPTATQTLLFSEQFGGEPHTASATVLMPVLLCVATIPLMYLLFSIF